MMEQLRNEFLYPSSEYTPIPFWFWNDDLKEQEIIRQIHDFKDKGVDGFVIHSRIGIPKAIGYLSDRFMELVELAVKEATLLDMKVVLYDEGMYPSGSANGMVVKDNPEYASRGLKMIPYECSGATEIILALEGGDKLIAALATQRTGKDTIDPDSIKVLDELDGKVSFMPPISEDWLILLFVETYSKGHIRGIHFGQDDGEPNAPPSTDLLNPKAIQKFIRLTHERYFERLHGYFGTTIIGMFTDEPSILGRDALLDIIPWTPGFLEWYLDHGNDIKDLPALWMNIGKDTGHIKRQYKRAVNKRLEMAYYEPIYRWCHEHNIALMGHPEASDDIGVLKYFHIPGQDIVWRWVAPEDGKSLEGVHSTQGKCSSDAARHAGRRRNSNECFGCCGPNGIDWAFTIDDMKWYMDWLFVRGVNLLYPHAFFYSIDGERRYGERPPDVGPNNLWWPHYRQISDYIKRMSWLMTDIINTTPIAVLCQEDKLPWAIVKPLFENQIEFNYLQGEFFRDGDIRIEEGFITIQNHRYGILVIEDIDLINVYTQDKMQEFIDQGGHIVLYNPDFKNIDLIGINEIHNMDTIVDILDSLIGSKVCLDRAHRDLRISHVKKGNMHFYLLVNEGEGSIFRKMIIDVIGEAQQWDGWGGTIIPAFVDRVENNKMEVDIKLSRRQSLIIAVDPLEPFKVNPIRLAVDEHDIKILKDGWNIKDGPVPADNSLDLKSWTDYPEMEHFSGTLIYENKFILNSTLCTGEKVFIDLGEVYDIAHLELNGKDVGVCMWAPYIFDATQYIQKNENILRIKVTNTIGNRISGAKLPSGLLGPVKLKKQSFITKECTYEKGKKA
ncbi:MAG TPA: glycosyl hydrolase [Clostridia bacterium]|nr:glycosyl hydrolase [Clostridia bacterium]